MACHPAAASGTCGPADITLSSWLLACLKRFQHRRETASPSVLGWPGMHLCARRRATGGRPCGGACAQSSFVRGRHGFRSPCGTVGAALLLTAGGLFVRFAVRGRRLGEGRCVSAGAVGGRRACRNGEDSGGCGVADDIHGAAAAARGQLSLRVRARRAPRGPGMHPGTISPAVTQVNLATTICRKGGYTKNIRPPEAVTGKEKRVNDASYGYTGSVGDAECDHLISLQLEVTRTTPPATCGWTRPNRATRRAAGSTTRRTRWRRSRTPPSAPARSDSRLRRLAQWD